MVNADFQRSSFDCPQHKLSPNKALKYCFVYCYEKLLPKCPKKESGIHNCYRQLHVESKVIKSLVSVKYVSCEVYQIINLQNYARLVQKLHCEGQPK